MSLKSDFGVNNHAALFVGENIDISALGVGSWFFWREKTLEAYRKFPSCMRRGKWACASSYAGSLPEVLGLTRLSQQSGPREASDGRTCSDVECEGTPITGL
jgi:hypothetical protein